MGSLLAYVYNARLSRINSEPLGDYKGIFWCGGR